MKLNKKGFSLIEIFVVLIIVGFLATISIPNIKAVFQKQKASEAIETLNSLKQPLITCLQANYNKVNNNCDNLATLLNVPDPVSSSNFTYTWGGECGVNCNPAITKNQVAGISATLKGGDPAKDVISILCFSLGFCRCTVPMGGTFRSSTCPEFDPDG